MSRIIVFFILDDRINKKSYSLNKSNLRQKIKQDSNEIFKNRSNQLNAPYGSGKSYYVRLLCLYFYYKYGTLPLYSNFWWRKPAFSFLSKRESSITFHGISINISGTAIESFLYFILWFFDYLLKIILIIFWKLISFSFKNSFIIIIDEPDRNINKNVPLHLNKIHESKIPFILMQSLPISHEDKFITHSITLPNNGMSKINLRFADVFYKRKKEFIKFWEKYFSWDIVSEKAFSRWVRFNTILVEEIKIKNIISSKLRLIGSDIDKFKPKGENGGVFSSNTNLYSDKIWNYKIKEIIKKLRKEKLWTDFDDLNTTKLIDFRYEQWSNLNNEINLNNILELLDDDFVAKFQKRINFEEYIYLNSEKAKNLINAYESELKEFVVYLSKEKENIGIQKILDSITNLVDINDYLFNMVVSSKENDYKQLFITEEKCYEMIKNTENVIFLLQQKKDNCKKIINKILSRILRNRLYINDEKFISKFNLSQNDLSIEDFNFFIITDKYNEQQLNSLIKSINNESFIEVRKILSEIITNINNDIGLNKKSKENNLYILKNIKIPNVDKNYFFQALARNRLKEKLNKVIIDLEIKLK